MRHNASPVFNSVADLPTYRTKKSVRTTRATSPNTCSGGLDLCRVANLAGALTYAQLAALIPRSGGWYAFLRTTLAEFPAFLIG